MAKVMWVIQGDCQLKGALLHPFVRFKMGFLRDFEGGRLKRDYWSVWLGKDSWTRGECVCLCPSSNNIMFQLIRHDQEKSRFPE